jgi:hypothetical protein
MGPDPNSTDTSIQKLMDAVVMLANANTEVNLRRREALKPELHPSYQHLCMPSNPITSQLFGDDLPKAVKDIAEPNKISSKLQTERRMRDRMGTNNIRQEHIRNDSKMSS